MDSKLNDMLGSFVQVRLELILLTLSRSRVVPKI